MLMSVSTSDVLTFASVSSSTAPSPRPFARNDTSCLWLYGTQAAYCSQPSRPFRTAIIDEAIGANANGLIATGQPQLNLGLYSITLNNDVDLDHAALARSARFAKRRGEKAFDIFWKCFRRTPP